MRNPGVYNRFRRSFPQEYLRFRREASAGDKASPPRVAAAAQAGVQPAAEAEVSRLY